MPILAVAMPHLEVKDMPEIEEDVITGSHTEDESHDQENDIDTDEVMSLFGIEKEEKSVNDKTPAKEDVEPEKKIIKVKVDKEEREFDISDDKLPEYVQKAYALDKERERKAELEKNLDRAAKLAGYADHAAYVADLDKLEKAQEEQKQTELDELKNHLLDEIEDAGINREEAEKYIENSPVFVEAKRVLEERQKAAEQASEASKWQPLYKAYPELEEAVIKAEGKPVDWYTPELAALIERGNDPLLAYEHLNRDKIKQSTKKATEQRILKEQQLGLRSRVEIDSPPDNEPQVPEVLASAFAAFGLPAEAAKKYVK